MTESARDRLLRDAPEKLSRLTTREFGALSYEWRFWARPDQRPPHGDWRYWVILAGRGFGRTRTGAEWALEQARIVVPYIKRK